jgi:uncharacterized membrane protein
MGLFSIFDRFRSAQQHFSEADEQRIVEAIRQAEMRTSGEIRIYIEHRCKFVDPVDRAAELFFGLQMEQTQDRNGVLIYLAMKDRQLAVFGDEGIHRIVGSEFWNREVAKILAEFGALHYVDGITTIIHDIGEVLQEKFPYHSEDRNELPDNIIFGR